MTRIDNGNEMHQSLMYLVLICVCIHDSWISRISQNRAIVT